RLHLEVQHSNSTVVAFPVLPDSINGIDIVRREQPKRSQSGDTISESVTFVITAFDSGMHIVPSIPVQYTVNGDTAKKYVQTSPQVFVVGTIAIDTSKGIKDIKPPLAVGISFAEILPYLIALVILAGIVWLILYIRKKRRRGESLIPEAPKLPANVAALEALRVLEAERVWQRGLVKDYHSQLTDILRIYIEGRFSVTAMEMTSDEILSSPAVASLPRELQNVLREVLLRADLVKFAKSQPLPQEHESSLTASRSFVETSWKPAEEQVRHEVTPEVAS
ncbi:MAG TPA: hypothetical protein VKI62_09725, partial [Bacteroidota bacterium]|nr:hypothetical protein [Bacteroidota bacterium]